MIEYDIPCPYCCKHVSITPKQFRDGAVVTCRHCRMNIKIKSHPDHKIEVKGKPK